MFSKILSRIIFILLLVTTLTPLVYQKKLFYSYETEKGFFFRFILEIMLGLWLILILKEPTFRPKKTLINVALGVIAIVLIIVDIFSVNPYLSIFSNFERMAGLILYLSIFAYCLIITSIMNTPRRWLAFGIILSIVSQIVSLKGIIQSYDTLEMQENGGRIVATIGNPNQLASYLLLGFFIVGSLLTEWVIPMKKTKKTLSHLLLFLSGLALIVYSTCLLKTSTRGAILGFTLGMFLILILLFFKIQKPKLKLIIGIVFSTLLLSIVTLYSLRKTEFVKQNFVLNRITINDGSSTFNSRLENYKIAIDGFKAKPILGWGQETYHYTYAQYFNTKMYDDAPWYDRVHNIILEWMIMGGVLGITAYFLLWGAILYQLKNKNCKINIYTKYIISGFLLAYCITNLFLFDTLLSLMAFITVISFIESHSIQETKTPPYIFSNKIILFGSVLIIILTTYILKTTCINAYQTNKSIAKAFDAESLEEVIGIYDQTYQKALIGRQEIAEQLANMVNDIANSPIPENTKNLYFETTHRILQKELSAHPNYVRLQVMLANVFKAEKNYTESIKIHEKVRMIAPKYQKNLTDLALLYAKNSNLQKGMKMLKEILVIEPLNDEAKINQAIIFALNEDTLSRNKIINNISEKALNKYINEIKYAYSLTNDWAEFFRIHRRTSIITTEYFYQDWAITAFQLKNYREASLATFLYRIAYSGLVFADKRPINILRQDVLNGKDPSFAFEKAE